MSSDEDYFVRTIVFIDQIRSFTRSFPVTTSIHAARTRRRSLRSLYPLENGPAPHMRLPTNGNEKAPSRAGRGLSVVRGRLVPGECYLTGLFLAPPLEEGEEDTRQGDDEGEDAEEPLDVERARVERRGQPAVGGDERGGGEGDQRPEDGRRVAALVRLLQVHRVFLRLPQQQRADDEGDRRDRDG